MEKWELRPWPKWRRTANDLVGTRYGNSNNNYAVYL